MEVIKCFTRRLRRVGNCFVLTVPPMVAGVILSVNPEGEVLIKLTREGILIVPKPKRR